MQISWLVRGAQSALFYYFSLTPYHEAKHRYRVRQQNKHDRKAREERKKEFPDEYQHPYARDTNPYWAEEIRAGPGPPERKKARKGLRESEEEEKKQKNRRWQKWRQMREQQKAIEAERRAARHNASGRRRSQSMPARVRTHSGSGGEGDAMRRRVSRAGSTTSSGSRRARAHRLAREERMSVSTIDGMMQKSKDVADALLHPHEAWRRWQRKDEQLWGTPSALFSREAVGDELAQVPEHDEGEEEREGDGSYTHIPQIRRRSSNGSITSGVPVSAQKRRHSQAYLEQMPTDTYAAKHSADGSLLHAISDTHFGGNSNGSTSNSNSNSNTLGLVAPPASRSLDSRASQHSSNPAPFPTSGPAAPLYSHRGRNPPVNDLHPPVASNAAFVRSSASGYQWMLQPPPDASVMAGYDDPASAAQPTLNAQLLSGAPVSRSGSTRYSRSRSVSNLTSGRDTSSRGGSSSISDFWTKRDLVAAGSRLEMEYIASRERAAAEGKESTRKRAGTGASESEKEKGKEKRSESVEGEAPPSSAAGSKRSARSRKKGTNARLSNHAGTDGTADTMGPAVDRPDMGDSAVDVSAGAAGPVAGGRKPTERSASENRKSKKQTAVAASSAIDAETPQDAETGAMSPSILRSSQPVSPYAPQVQRARAEGMGFWNPLPAAY